MSLKSDEERLLRFSSQFERRRAKHMNDKRGIHYKDLKRGKAAVDTDY
jgi:hypothetical protein